MLTITLPELELFDDNDNSFTTLPEITLQLEHSLVSLSKWESRFEKSFLGPAEKTKEESIAYIECMILTPDYPSDVLNRITLDQVTKVNDYIDSKQTGTSFHEYRNNKSKNKEIITAELIYYWMFSAQIPLQCENWHLNRLFTLLRVYGIKNSKQKKMSSHELAMRQREINEQRRAQLGTSG